MDTSKLNRYLLIVILLISCIGGALADLDPQDKHFVFTYPVNRAVLPYTTDQSLSLRIYSYDEKITGKIRSGDNLNRKFKIPANSSLKITLPANLAVASSDVVEINRGIEIISNHKIDVYAYNIVTHLASGTITTSDAYKVLPTSSLGAEYVVASYNGWGSLFSVVGTEDDTVVKILPSETINPFTDIFLGEYVNNFHPAGVPYFIVLNKGDVYQLRYGSGDVANESGDLSGTIIKSNKAITVIAGNRLQYVPWKVLYADHLLSQMIPTKRWGTEYSVMPYASQEYDLFRIFAKDDDTTVSINGIQGALLTAGQFYEFYSSNPIYIEGTKPVQVAKYSVGSGSIEKYGDPSMNILTGDSLGGVNHKFSIPSGYDKMFVNIVVDASDINSVLINGSLVNASLFQPISGGSRFGAQLPIVKDFDYEVKTVFPSTVTVYGFSLASGISFDTR